MKVGSLDVPVRWWLLMSWLLTALLLPFASIAQAADQAPDTTYKVGMAHRSIVPPGPYDWRGATTHALLTTIWYPAAPEAVEDQQWMGFPGQYLARAGKAAPNAALAPGSKRFPMIVLSHGTGGSALMMAWLGTRLAAHGYIAVAVNHPGNNALEKYTVPGFVLWWDRATDLGVVISHMLSDRVFSSRINDNEIGASGFSIGGNTVITLAGGLTSPQKLQAFCSSPDADQTCNDPPEFPGLSAKIKAAQNSDPEFGAALASSDQSHRDPRVKAVFAMAPALGRAFEPESLSQIAVPVEIVAGEADEIMPPKNNAEWLAGHIPKSRLVLLPKVGHYTFLAVCTDDQLKRKPELCADQTGVDRDRVHQKAAEMAVHFFDKVFGIAN